jgi:hypothetical protein
MGNVPQRVGSDNPPSTKTDYFEVRRYHEDQRPMPLNPLRNRRRKDGWLLLACLEEKGSDVCYSTMIYGDQDGRSEAGALLLRYSMGPLQVSEEHCYENHSRVEALDSQ